MKYSSKPQKITKTSWFYEDLEGIIVVQELWNKNQYMGTCMCTLPWEKLKASVKRHIEPQTSRAALAQETKG
jgi:hypothetical protein